MTKPHVATARRRRAPAFTLVELLVVIFVVGLLTVIIVTVASKAVHGQRVANTRSIMDNTTLAIEQFATEDPFRAVYNVARGGAGGSRVEPTFGPYPPYQLDARQTSASSVGGIVEPLAVRTTPYTLEQRLHRDLGGGVGNVQDYVAINTQDREPNDDIRALYAYLRGANARLAGQIPPTALKPLKAGLVEFANPTGGGVTPGTNGLFDVFGIHDAWGVPLDYFLYVKLERYPRDDGTVGWRVSDRIPVLRSHGISREEYDADSEHSGGDIYSTPLPEPHAGVNDDGVLNSPNDGRTGGWVRARAAAAPGNASVEEEYGYLPE
ncbi:MAG: prepilin-type N-terminal cleavage/methylation domain-containing protein [Phycisphaerae bacterium]